MGKKIIKVLLCVLLMTTLAACKEENNDIVIIYTSDVHGQANENIGFAGVLSFKEEKLKETPNVTLVDAGDAIVGTAYTQMSEGEAIVECMNAVGYDYMSFGNHEFDFGIARLGEIIDKAEGKYLNSNIVYIGKSGDGDFINELSSYEIVDYGSMKVGYLAVDTPSTLIDTTPSKIKEDGVYCLDFYFDDVTDNFFANIQNIVDEMKEKGADKIVCISHLGYDEEYAPYSSNDLAKNTSDIDVIIDGHEHINMPSSYKTNKDGKQVIITSCGTGLANIGYITISTNGTVNATTISNYEPVNDKNTELFNEMVDRYSADLLKELTKTNCALPIADENGVRMVRSREMSVGDLFADAFRYYGESDIAFINGGGIRAGVPEGSVSYADLIEIAPFENKLAVIEITGQELVDYLEYSYRNVKSEYTKDGKAYGEDGSFMQISGMRLTVDTSVATDINVDENDAMLGVNGNRRVKNVEILENGEYVPIDLNKTYTLAGNDYTLLDGGSGTAVMFQDNNTVIKTQTLYSQVLIDYIVKVLNSDLSAYSEPDGRITIK